MCLTEAIKKFDFEDEKLKTKGQGFIPLPQGKEFVSSGDGPHTNRTEDYHIRMWYGRPEPFLKREKAGIVNFLGCVVYTREAYLKDPDVIKDDSEHYRISMSTYTHVLVAVKASGGGQAPRSAWTFTRNLAGANLDAANSSKQELIEEAQEVIDHHEKWCTVAD
jgi:hypothetical protein